MRLLSSRWWRHRLRRAGEVLARGPRPNRVGPHWRRRVRRTGQLFLVVLFVGVMGLTFGDQTKLGRDFRRFLRLPEGSAASQAQKCGRPDTLIGTVTTDR